jgi:ArsR family transcriptional regulator
VLDALAPVFEQVIAVDREPVQLAQARERLRRRGYTNVTLLCDDFDSDAVASFVDERGGADVVFASRVLHHAPKPAGAIAAMANLLKPGGALIVVDYAPHDREVMREQQADLWLGFSDEELAGFARRAGLTDTSVYSVDGGRCGNGPDSVLGWHSMVARRPRVHALNAHKAGSQGRR